MVYYASSPICNMCVYIIFPFNPTTFSVFKEAGLSTLLWLIWSCRWCQPWNDLFSWVELMIFQWKKKNSGKWILSDVTCPIPRSIMISEGRVILGYRLFSKAKYLYNSKSQFSHKFTLLSYRKSPVVKLPHLFFTIDISISFYFFWISFSVLFSTCKPTNTGLRPNF